MKNDYVGDVIIKEFDWYEIKPFWEKYKDNWETHPHDIFWIDKPYVLDVETLFKYKEEKTFGMLTMGNDLIIGCLQILDKRYIKKLKIGGIANIAIDTKYRKCGLASLLMKIALLYMFYHDFDISILWASVPEMYYRFGYMPIQDNMMYRAIRGLPNEYSINDLVSIPGEIGVW